ncbi:MAG: Maf family protein [Chloroflexi bacterium]|nr:Maf family protein [Chloroflexota bacterium]
MQLILASQSPRRRSLLAALGLTFTVDAADVDETPRPDEAPADLVCRLGRIKAVAVAARHPRAVVLAADTVVVLDGTLLGKPVDPAEAWAMLHALRGRTHQVYTAVTVTRAGAPCSRLSISDVTMRPYSDAEIATYVASGDPLDKAGAYAIQHPLFAPVAGWTGCYTAIMGLPLGVAADLLREAGVLVPGDVAATCEGIGGRCCLRGFAGS